ncbi:MULTISPECIES: Ail/Lom family outer membrane beta-barrel protein [Proteus]|uniref:Ail/Lom family outer membrane beta-barrel protein n=1 Tax=Proteus TaxID=583 RepID=UPI000D6DEC1B|nr:MULTISPECIES: Ail/Lom family outer membrane beta-barrel protein [Proteus]MBG2838872.1 outer membrane beta-barrel protein [Proteus terrae subsp. cibarius]MBG2869339.1 outer membrane beta-barrel protein [Proteus terrae subsp. cibarius]MBJ2108137.1 outer membrane beta-barrel protein [Proteus terrae]MBJ2132009.1 outer membrane beta-barrel protein [Proteus terrae]MCS6715072.1 outer membrane beta-barrel protein [Proteus terrae]
MRRNLFISTSLLAISTLSFNAQAALDNTLSVGYAQTSIKVDDKMDDDLKGINFKYNHEFDNNWGVIGSLTYTKLTYNYYGRWGKIGSTEIDYVSLTAGPSYRFNDYFSAYGLIGLGHINQEDNFFYDNDNDKLSKSSMAYGLGLQINPIPNVAIDASYEYSKIDGAKFGTWILGVGYRF